MENKCVYKAWVAPKSNTESGTQEVMHSDSDVKYRFESCPDYTLKTKQMELLISILIVTSISTFIAVFWVRGINYMHENHSDYKGEDLFDEDLNKNKQTNT